MFTYLGEPLCTVMLQKESHFAAISVYENFENTVESTVYDIDWQYINRYKMENLFGYILRNVFHGILTCQPRDGNDSEQLDSCLLER